jgi:K+-sensing histidine kinase KdpD
MKEKISEKEQFFSKVSHDLRGSFTSILGFSDILNDPNEVLTIEEINEFSTRIQAQSKDTFDLLVNFINWLKLENYKYGLSYENIEIYDALLETKNNLKKNFNEKNIDVNLSVGKDETVLMDYEILLSIVNNVFMFLVKVCCNNSTISIKSVNPNLQKTTLEISANCDKDKSSFLNNLNLRSLNNDLSFPIIFALKFTELSGGAFDFALDQKNNLIISLQLPKEQKN